MAAGNPDIKLLFGVATGGTDGGDSEAIIRDGLKAIVDNINRTPFKIKFDIDPESVNKIKQQVENALKELGATRAASGNLNIGLNPNATRDAIGQLEAITKLEGASERIISGLNNVPIGNGIGKIAEALSSIGVSGDKANEIAQSFGNLNGTISSIRVNWNGFEEDSQGVTRVVVTGVDSMSNKFQEAVTYCRQLNAEGEEIERLFRSGGANMKFSPAISPDSEAFTAAQAQIDALILKVEDAKGKYAEIGSSDTGKPAIAGLEEQKQKLDELKASLESGTLTEKEYAEEKARTSGIISSYIAQLSALNNEQNRSNNATPISPDSEAFTAAQAQINAAIFQGKQALRDYSAAKVSFNQSSREAYGAIQSEVIQQGRLQSELEGGKLSQKEFDREMERSNGVIEKNKEIIKANGDAHKGFGSSIRGAVGAIKNYVSAARIMMAVVRKIREMISASVELDTSLTQLKIVTGASNAQMKEFANTAFELSQTLGQSTTSVLSSIETFSRLGYSLSDASKLTEYATILSNVAGVSTEDATTGLTSIIKGYNFDVENAEHVADVLVQVGQKYAVSASEMMEAFSKSGAALNATNTSFEKSAGLIAAANSAVQNSSIVGTALKTVSARIRGSKTELSELGEDVEELADGFSKYEKEFKALTGVEIIKEGTKDQFKDIYDIFNEVSEVWNRLSDTQKSRVSEILGGTRQLQVISSIISNWKDAAKAYTDAMDSAGASTKANEIYLESVQAKINQLKARFEELALTLFSSDFMSQIVGIGQGFINFFNKISKFINLFGGLKTVIKSILTYIGAKKIIQITLSIVALSRKVHATGNIIKAFGLSAKTAMKSVETGANSAKVAVSSLNVYVAIATIALTAIIGIVSRIKQSEEEAAEAAKEAYRQTQENAQEAYDKHTQLTEAIEKYEELGKSLNYDGSVKNIDEAKTLQETINNLLGDQADSIDVVNGKYEKQLATLKQIAYVDGNKLADAEAAYIASKENIEGALSYDSDYLAELSDKLDNGWSTDVLNFLNRYADKHYLELHPDNYQKIGRGFSITRDNRLDTGTSNDDYWEWFYKNIPGAKEDTVFDPTAIPAMFKGKSKRDVYDILRQWQEMLFDVYDNNLYINDELYSIMPTADYDKSDLSNAISKVSSAINDLEKQFEEAETAKNNFFSMKAGSDVYNYLTENNISSQKQLEDLLHEIWANKTFNGEKVSNDYATFLTNQFERALGDKFEIPDKYKKSVISGYYDFANGVIKDVKNLEIESPVDAAIKGAFLSGSKDDLTSWFNSMSVDEFEQFVKWWNDNLDSLDIDDIRNGVGGIQDAFAAYREGLRELGNADVSNFSLPDLTEIAKNTEKAYDVLKTAREEMISGAGLSAKTIESLKELTSEYADYLYTENGVIKLNIEKWTKDFVDKDFSTAISNINDELDRLKDNQKIYELIEQAQEVGKDNEDLIHQVEELTGLSWDEALKTYAGSAEDTSKSISELNKQLELFEALQKKITQQAQEVDYLKGLQGTQGAFDILDKIFKDIKDGEDFDWSSVLNNTNFDAAFGTLGSSYTNFVDTVTKNTGNIDACREAFNSLVSEYINSTGVLNDVTEETKAQTVAYLEQMGVTNAAQVVEQALVTEKEYLALKTGECAGKTSEEIQALYDSCTAGDAAKEAYARLAFEKKILADTRLNTEQDVAALIVLAEQAKVTGETLNNLARIKGLFAEADMLEEMGFNGGAKANRELANTLLSELKSTAFDYSSSVYDFIYGGGSVSNGDGSKTSTKSAFEQEYDRRQHLLKMEQISEQDFYTWLENTMYSAYNSGMIDLEKLWSLEESVYNWRKEAYGEESNWFEEEYRDRQHRINMGLETEAEFFNWLANAYKTAYYQGRISLEDYYKYEESVHEWRKKAYGEEDDWFKREYDNRQHRLKMGWDTEQQYYNWLSSSYKQAYKQGRITHDEYLKYMEEINDYNNSLFEKYLSKKEHEMSIHSGGYAGQLLKTKNLTNSQIISWYMTLQNDILKKINDLRKAGLSASDDRIKELQDKYISYANEVQNLIKDSFDDIEFKLKYNADITGNSAALISGYHNLFVKLDTERKRYLAEGHDLTDEYTQYLINSMQSTEQKLLDSMKSIYSGYDFGAELHERYYGVDSHHNLSNVAWDYSQKVDRIKADIDYLIRIGQWDINKSEYQDLMREYWEARDVLSSIYEQTEKDAKSSLNSLIDAVIDMRKQEAADEKELLNDRLDNLRTFYQKQKDMLRDMYDEEKYLEEQAEKRKKVSDIRTEMSRLENDDSAWAQKRRAELQKELSDAEKELNNFERDHALDTVQKDLDNQLEAEEKVINAQIEQLDKVGENAEEERQKALEALKSGEVDLDMLVEYTKIHGDGIGEEIVDMWNNAILNMTRYFDLFGKYLNDYNIQNYSGYNIASDSTKFEYLQTKKQTKNFRLTTSYAGHGYASGTNSALRGIHRIDEDGINETIFESSDGNRYKMFSGGEKVLNARASNFLYDFANSGKEIISNIVKSMLGGSVPYNVQPIMNTVHVNEGDIIIRGNANENTVSEIRRIKRDTIDTVLKNLVKLKDK